MTTPIRRVRPLGPAGHRCRNPASLWAILLLPWLLIPVSGLAQKFYPDDPIRRDADDLAIPKPEAVPSVKLLDLLKKSFVYKPALLSPPAANVNTLGEVPDSSWFTNRIGGREMTLEELKKGPTEGPGPDVSQTLVIQSLKLDGVTPGFVLRDARGEVYFCKVDPIDYPQMTTSAELISSRFFYALGYNVPENYLVFIDPDRLVLRSGIQVTGKTGKTTVLTAARLRGILRHVPKRPDGTIQVFASLRLPGELIGPFEYSGMRHDDPNDVFPHQDRRELRGLRVFASWLNHNDSDTTNTLDSYLTQGDRSFVRHYLIDFGTTLGSGAVVPHPQRAGHEYFFESGPILKGLATFGLWTRPWQHIPYSGYPSIGRFESKVFDPAQWRPDYPNPAFDNLQNQDALWASNILARFDDARIRAIVETGQLQNQAAEDYLVRTLVERRDKILRHWLSQINPLVEFQLQIPSEPASRRLDFRNLGLELGLVDVTTYLYQWFEFDNRSSELSELGQESKVSLPSLPVPSHPASHLMVRIRSQSADQPDWGKAVDVYLRNIATPGVVGIDRED